MENNTLLPNNKELQNAILLSLEQLGGEASTADINKNVISLLNISDEQLKIEHPDGLCSLFDYKMRWARTALKGRISNTKRGIWALVQIENE